MKIEESTVVWLSSPRFDKSQHQCAEPAIWAAYPQDNTAHRSNEVDCKMNDGNPPNLALNRLTDPRNFYGFAHQQQLQPTLANFLNQGTGTNQQKQLQMIQSMFQQQPMQNQLNLQSFGQRQSQPLHLGLLQNVNNLSPSTLAGLGPDLQTQLARTLAGPSSQRTDLLLAIEKQSILDRARALNQMEIRRALEREQEQHQATSLRRNQIASIRPQEQLPQQVTASFAPTNLTTASLVLTNPTPANRNPPNPQAITIDSALGQPLRVDAISRVSDETTSESSGDGLQQVSAPPLPFAVGEGGVKDLRMVQDSTWEARFRDLFQFKMQHGHCNVPRRYKGDPKLGVWVCSLRQQMTRGTLNKAKVERLNQIGFQWRITVIKGAQINPQIAKADKWNDRFQLVASIKQRTGSCKVPTTDRKLTKWVYRQRREMSRGKLSIEKQEKLNSIGFQWKEEDKES